MKPVIQIEDFDYPIPEERIAKFPLPNRDDSKLLLNIDDNLRSVPFKSISEYIPTQSLMVFNETKVVPARLFFKRSTGSVIEVFCLEPFAPNDYAISFIQTEKCSWKCIVGNIKRWKEEYISFYTGDNCNKVVEDLELKARLVERNENTAIVEFSWKGGLPFSKVMEMCGQIPIPPYLNRETEAIDVERYQTIYAQREGSVAAPTAGLHFTDKEFKDLFNKGIERVNLCLHVGAGTFLPVKSKYISDHTMHSEPFSVSKEALNTILSYLEAEKSIITVGTTSTRCIESLYYLGVHCIENGEPGFVAQWEPYRDEGYSYTTVESFKALIKYLEDNNLESITSRTSVIIVPSYKFNVIDYIVTNFHQPKSTLLLLISAMIDDNWREMYSFALENDFRFLSYGDSSLIKIKNKIVNGKI